MLETSGETIIRQEQVPPIKKKKKHGKTKKICYRWRSKVNKLQDQINEEELGNPSEKECRVMIVKNFQNIENRIDKMQEMFNTFNKDLEEIKK